MVGGLVWGMWGDFIWGGWCSGGWFHMERLAVSVEPHVQLKSDRIAAATRIQRNVRAMEVWNCS